MFVLVLASLGAPAAHARDLGAPLPPLAVEAAAADGGVLVTWSPPADEGAAPVLAYHVHRLAAPTGGWEKAGTTDASARSFLDAGSDGALAYAVSAANENGDSLRSVAALCIPLNDEVPVTQIVDWDCVWDTADSVMPPCDVVGIAGTPPTVGINWDCLPHPAIRFVPR